MESIIKIRRDYMVFNNIFSYIVMVSFIDGGNQSTQRKPPTCCK